MNEYKSLFNANILKKILLKYDKSSIPNFSEKIIEIAKWKKSIESGNLAKTKETSIQGKFLTSVFEKILGYNTLIENSEEFNQIQEFKSVADSSEADGALGFFTIKEKDIRAVIELKDACTDLDRKQNRANPQTPVEQAFSYANKNGAKCSWVIVSNFIEIRLYRSISSLEYERFLVTELNDEDAFKKFYYLLSKDNLISKPSKSIIDFLYAESEQAGQEICDKFYLDYKNLRQNLYTILRENNPGVDPLVLFTKSQKILDRFVFICFCEDSGLLPLNIFKEMVNNAQKSFSMSPSKVWNELKGLFESIDKGNPPLHINAYNGGLFCQDDIINALVVPDKAILPFVTLADYDFSTDLNVNILGHIFEHSISDIEQVKAEINGEVFDKKESKQKKDGIYYTPEYITKYIVENTVGRWLHDRKEEIKNDLFKNGPYVATIERTKKGESSKTTKVKVWKEIENCNSDELAAIKDLHQTFWTKYLEALSNIKILDPTCGSGAFLNQAFDYLSKEAMFVNETLTALREGQTFMFDWDKHILQNNLFGVDLNPESVEITKLSLWLKTASQNKPLASLDNSIKCGNSIISDPRVAGEWAFDWSEEFKEIIDAGGFDIVIGNPPYGAKLSKEEKDYISKNYETTEYNFDTYKTFFEKGMGLLKKNCYLGFITPNTYFMYEYSENLRRFLFCNFQLLNVVELFNVFDNAVVEPAISIYSKKMPRPDSTFDVITIPRKTILNSTFLNNGVRTIFKQENLTERGLYCFNYRENSMTKPLRIKLESNSFPFGDMFNVTFGVKLYQVGKGVPKQTKQILIDRPFTGFSKENDNWLPLFRGKNITRYSKKWDGEYVYYGEWLAEPRTKETFNRKKLFVRQTGDYPIATFLDELAISEATLHCVYPKSIKDEIYLKYILGLLNSKLLKWIFQHENFQIVGKPLAQVTTTYLKKLPIRIDCQNELTRQVEELLAKHQLLYELSKQFILYIEERYKIRKTSERLEFFFLLTFSDFLGELKKQKVILSASQEMSLHSLFKEKSEELFSLSRQINEMDKELDCLVYQIYKLTPEEITLIEESHL